MARSTRSSDQAQPNPQRDRAYAPRRIDDTPAFWVDSIAGRLVWPLTVVFLALLGGTAAVWLRDGETRALALLSFLQGPAFVGVCSVIAIAATAVLRKVPQLGRFEKRQAATQAEVQQARDLAEQVLATVKAQPPSAPREPDPTTGEVKALVVQLASRMARIEDNALAAAKAAGNAQAAVAGYGASLQSIAAGVTAVTGSTPAQPSPEPSPEPEWPGSRYGRPQARSEAEEAYEDWSRREGSHRAQTTQQPAVPAAPADEHEDWQEVDDGQGLDTGYRSDFREQMAAAEARERAAREARTSMPPPWTPRFPPPQPAADPDEERARQQRARRWTNPEEGD